MVSRVAASIASRPPPSPSPTGRKGPVLGFGRDTPGWPTAAGSVVGSLGGSVGGWGGADGSTGGSDEGDVPALSK